MEIIRHASLKESRLINKSEFLDFGACLDSLNQILSSAGSAANGIGFIHTIESHNACFLMRLYTQMFTFFYLFTVYLLFLNDVEIMLLTTHQNRLSADHFFKDQSSFEKLLN